MEIINALIASMDWNIKNPEGVVKRYKSDTGKDVIGCFPEYCPEEIIHAAGMLPIGLWGGQTDIELSKAYLPAFACSLMQSCLEHGLGGRYDDLSAVLIPALCDTLICIGENWKVGVQQVQRISLVHPQNRKMEAGIQYLRSEYTRIKESLEKISGEPITDEAINISIEIYNEHRETMRRFVDVAACNPHIMVPLKRNIVIKSGYYMLKEDHTKLVNELIEEIGKVQVESKPYKRILLSGIMADSKVMLELLEDHQLAVVADDLAQESRQFRHDVPQGNDGLHRLAKYWSIFEGCSLAYAPDESRGDILLKDIKDKDIDAVIFCMMQFCDPEEYDYPLLKKRLDEAGIPSLFIEMDLQVSNTEQIRTRIQTFSEILSY